MAVSNRERIARAMEQLRAGLIPFAEREFKARLGGYWVEEVSQRVPIKKRADGEVDWDTQALLKAIGDNWQGVFRHVLGHVERSYVGELRDVRNRWAHEETFSSDDTERALDTMKRLLESISAGEQAEAVGKLRTDLQRTIYDEQARNKTRYQLTLAGMPKASLKPWRKIATPHPDVQSGRYMQAEFAADLAQVARGEGSVEYRDPIEFFRRTYVTSGLHELLTDALRRLTGNGGDPVVELQTNFGGGKTHSMLALYHLFGDAPSADLPGLEPILNEVGTSASPKAHRAVLVGTDLSPAQIHEKPDGTRVRTLWGDMAWQLGGKKGYELVADSDAQGVSPGGNVFIELFRRHSPTVVLIDEWVAYARQLVGKHDLPAGTFDSQASFAQAITEAAAAVDKTLVVASVPASKIEIGGENGEHALETLKNVFERLGKPWRPATGDEGFEIVRRRLFEPITGKDSFANRDAVIRAFIKMYKAAPGDFPPGTSDEPFRRDLEAAYPIHPELFRRLYDDWSTLDKFQRTRGVLRLLAKVIHRLWESGDTNLMIMPAFIPMDDGAVKSELTRYLDDVWEPIISQDVDGETSLPMEIDRSTPNLGRVSAARRVSRTLYLGTAPDAQSKNPGIDDRSIRLGCVQPGETSGVFGDALRRLSARAKYIHQDQNRYWLSTKANLNRHAEDLAGGLRREPETLFVEIIDRLKKEQKRRAEFTAVHACPESPSDVPDEPSTRLVILPPQFVHRRGKDTTTARVAVDEFLESRGVGPRLERNCLVFLAPDERALDDLLEATAHYLAWKSIDREKERLNLDHSQVNQANAKVADTDTTVNLRITNTWIHMLVPRQEKATDPIVWDELKISGSDGLAKAASAKLVHEEALLPIMGGVPLRMQLDKHLWTDKPHVTVGELTQWFARHLYLPRLKNRETLIKAILNGADSLVPEDTFGVAEGWDGERKRYLGLHVGGGAPKALSHEALVVKTKVARQQLDAERPGPSSETASSAEESTAGAGAGSRDETSEAPARPNLFIGSVQLNPGRIGRDAGKVVEEVVQHLSTLPGAKTEVTLEIRVTVPDGYSEDTVRTVSENATTLKFQSKMFEKG